MKVSLGVDNNDVDLLFGVPQINIPSLGASSGASVTRPGYNSRFGKKAMLARPVIFPPWLRLYHLRVSLCGSCLTFLRYFTKVLVKIIRIRST